MSDFPSIIQADFIEKHTKSIPLMVNGIFQDWLYDVRHVSADMWAEVAKDDISYYVLQTTSLISRMWRHGKRALYNIGVENAYRVTLTYFKAQHNPIRLCDTKYIFEYLLEYFVEWLVEKVVYPIYPFTADSLQKAVNAMDFEKLFAEFMQEKQGNVKVEKPKIDSGVPFPNTEAMMILQNIVAQFGNVADPLRLKMGESIFVPFFPKDCLNVLTAALQTYMVVPIYTEADSVCGGAGVRIFSMYDVKNIGNKNPAIPQRKVGDWTAVRKDAETWKQRINSWLPNGDIDNCFFFWDCKKKWVELVYFPNKWREREDAYEISPFDAFLYSLDLYPSDPIYAIADKWKGGRKEPMPLSDERQEFHISYNWQNGDYFGYHVQPQETEDNSPVEDLCYFQNENDYIAYMGKTGVEAQWEDAPMIAFLAFHALNSEYGVSWRIEWEELNRDEADMGFDDL